MGETWLSALVVNDVADDVAEQTKNHCFIAHEQVS